MAWMAEFNQGKALQFIQMLPGGIYRDRKRFCWAIGHGGSALQQTLTQLLD